MAAKGPWTCRRCKARWENRRLRKCPDCGRKRAKKREPAHRAVLKLLTYEGFVEVNGGDFCWIGKRLGVKCKPSKSGKFDRDHDHKTGAARGLLCRYHNRMLPARFTFEFIEAAHEYMKRTQDSP